MIIFGLRSSTRRLAVVTRYCSVCGGTFAAALDKVVTKFSLFFVPLFPVRTRRTLTCTRCATTFRVSRKQAQRLR